MATVVNKTSVVTSCLFPRAYRKSGSPQGLLVLYLCAGSPQELHIELHNLETRPSGCHVTGMLPSLTISQTELLSNGSYSVP